MWTINSTAASELKLSGMSISRRSMSADVANLSFNRIDIPSGLTYGQSVVIRSDDTIVFAGVAGCATREGATRTTSIPVHGPWWYLDNCPMLFTREYYGVGNKTTAKGTLSGTLSSVISEIFSGTPFSSVLVLGTVDLPAIVIPETEFANQTRAQVLTAVLSKCGNVFTSCDHTQTPARLNILQQSSSSIETLTVADEICSSSSIKLRDDLIPESVGIAYSRNCSVEKKVNASIVTQGTYEEYLQYESSGGSQNDFRRVELAYHLAGNKQYISWRTDLNCWSAKSIFGYIQYGHRDGYLNELMYRLGLDIYRDGNASFYNDMTVGFEIVASPETGYSSGYADQFRFLYPGQEIPPSELLYNADTNPSGLHLVKVTFACEIRKYVGVLDEHVRDVNITLYGLKAGDLPSSSSDFHSRTVESSDIESAPASGTAAAMKAQFQNERAEGSITTKLPLTSIPLNTGKLTLTKSGDALGTGIVQDLSSDIYTSQTTITFGPPQQLGFQDFAALQNQ